MGLVGFFSNRSTFLARESWLGHTPQKQVEHRARVDFYREQLGRKLNRDRVNAELLNQDEAPELSSRSLSSESADTMLRGLPLKQEGSHIYEVSRRSSDRVDEDSPDQRIQHGLIEQQDRLAWEKAADKAAVEEFLANARAQGYKVILDKNLNVIDVKVLPKSERRQLQRQPAEVLDRTESSMSRSPNSVSDSVGVSDNSGKQNSADVKK